MTGAPHSSQWREGPAVWNNPNIAPGTAIATFVDGKYWQKDDDVPKNSAIYMGPDPFRPGFIVADQWKDHPAQLRYVQPEGNNDSNSAKAYHVIITPVVKK